MLGVRACIQTCCELRVLHVIDDSGGLLGLSAVIFEWSWRSLRPKHCRPELVSGFRLLVRAVVVFWREMVLIVIVLFV